MADELEVLEPAGSSVVYRNEKIEVLPLTIGKIPKLVRMARPVIDQVMALENLEGGDEAFIPVLLDLIEKHGETIYEAAALCIDKDVDWVAKGDLSEFVELAQKVIEVNRDFFVQKLGPLLAGRAKLSTGTGQTASSS